ncbi:MAG: FliI/YscN family ATPase [Chloroflexota bacterium]|nr:FliI/YscN family ATPase [Dehalococcoidia bacterium]MDW8047913.1 FliI/YscN family ATPase [Chloroflexota bacterium]
MSEELLYEAIARAPLYRREGTVVAVLGDTVSVRGVPLLPDEMVAIADPAGRPLIAQASGTRTAAARVTVLERGVIEVGARVRAMGRGLEAPVGEALVGRVLDGLGRPLDGRPLPRSLRWVPADAPPPPALERPPIRRSLATGVRAVDGFLTLGRGQRVGIFAGSGVGKSTLLGMLARGTTAEVTVLALIGERGREVREFIDHDLGPDALARCVVVASTSDNPPAMRLGAAKVATAIAEGFRNEGYDVLLLFDSLTRVAMAQREIGLAAGEPPTTRGYPPSVFSVLPQLVERAGPSARGSITAIYTVLVDGDDLDEPIADLARATLDGHIVLSRALANAGHYPPIDVLASVSRLAPKVASADHLAAATRLRSLLAAYEEARDLIAIGAYVRGADPRVDEAMDLRGDLEAFLRQRPDDLTPFDAAVRRLQEIAGMSGQAPAADAMWRDAA